MGYIKIELELLDFGKYSLKGIEVSKGTLNDEIYDTIKRLANDIDDIPFIPVVITEKIKAPSKINIDSDQELGAKRALPETTKLFTFLRTELKESNNVGGQIVHGIRTYFSMKNKVTLLDLQKLPILDIEDMTSRGYLSISEKEKLIMAKKFLKENYLLI